MPRTFPGQYRPPKELIAISFPRLVGAGALGLSDQGLEVSATAVDLPSPIPMGLGLAGLLLIGAAAGLVFDPGRVVGLVILVAFVAWSYQTWRQEYGVTSKRHLAWTEIEHAAHLASDREVVAVVLRHPLYGAGTPDALFFAPTEGIEELLAALRHHAPSLEVLGPLAPDDSEPDLTNDDHADWPAPE